MPPTGSSVASPAASARHDRDLQRRRSEECESRRSAKKDRNEIAANSTPPHRSMEKIEALIKRSGVFSTADTRHSAWPILGRPGHRRPCMIRFGKNHDPGWGALVGLSRHRPRRQSPVGSQYRSAPESLSISFRRSLDRRLMVGRIDAKNQSRIQRCLRAECTLPWGHCPSS